MLGALGEVTQEGQDLLRGQGVHLSVTELGRKRGEQVEVIFERVFFSNSSCGSQEKML